MATVYAVINQKGGVGKSTTAQTLAAGLVLKGHRVLAVDLDAQCNLSYSAGSELGKASALGAMLREIDPRSAIQHTRAFDIMAGSRSLSGADVYIDGVGKEYKLREALEAVQDLYDFIVIDTPPALGVLTVNALTASDKVVIPAQADIFSIMGIEQLVESIRPVKKYCNPTLQIAGILLTRYNPRSILSRDVSDMAEQLAARIGCKVFDAKIREAVAVKESQIVKQTLFQYAPSSKVAGDYLSFIDELIRGV